MKDNRAITMAEALPESDNVISEHLRALTKEELELVKMNIELQNKNEKLKEILRGVLLSGLVDNYFANKDFVYRIGDLTIGI